jgi:hypothetical protein
MGLRRYVASKDTTITNAYKENLTTRAVDSNMGSSDSLEVFSIYDQAGDGETELSRILIQFPIEQIQQDRENGNLPASGSVQFILKMDNAVHPNTLPKKYNIVVNPLSRSWSEGSGLDMETYRDLGISNWVSASATEAWSSEGGDYYVDSEYKQYFDTGDENLNVDVTDLVESWMTGSIDNNGLIIRLSSSLEDDTRSYYTKKFFARGSEFFYKKPWIEARYDTTIKDDRGRFYLYNPFAPVEQSYNNLYIYNVFKGKLVDLPQVGQGEIYVRLYEEPNLPLPLTGANGPLTLLDGSTVATGSWVSTGIYKVSLGIDTELTSVYDIWFDSVGNAIGAGGEILIVNPDAEEVHTKNEYVVSIKNLKSSYSNIEESRFYTFVRSKNWSPNSYTSVVTQTSNTIIDEMFYKIYRIADNMDVIPYGTGSMNHTRLSYDKNGNYFDLDMSLFEPGYTYGIKFVFSDMDNYHENSEIFKFRVEE